MKLNKTVIAFISSGVVVIILAGVLAYTATRANKDNGELVNPTITPTLEVVPTPTEEIIGDGDMVPIESDKPDLTPTPLPTVKPLQTKSIVPNIYLTTGYTKPAKLPPDNYNMHYYVEVDLNNQCVNIFIKNKETGKYDKLLNRFAASTGMASSPTPMGTYTLRKDPNGKVDYAATMYFTKWYSWGKYATRIDGPYLFHSYTFYDKNPELKKPTGIDMNNPNMKAYNSMGTPGSAGCIRLLIEHAKWIYENCKYGTIIDINNSHPVDAKLKYVLKPPPYGTTLTPDYPVKTMPPTTPSPTPTMTPKPTNTPTNTPNPTNTPALTPTVTPTATAGKDD